MELFHFEAVNTNFSIIHQPRYKKNSLHRDIICRIIEMAQIYNGYDLQAIWQLIQVLLGRHNIQGLQIDVSFFNIILL